MLRYEINQRLLRGGQRLREADLKKLLKVIAKVLRERKAWVISIAFVDKKEMARLNRDWRGQNYPTDVLSFIHKEGDLLGEVIICYPIAKVQAEVAGITTKEEILQLLTHGILHLFGHDHEKKKPADTMQALEEWIREARLK